MKKDILLKFNGYICGIVLVFSAVATFFLIHTIIHNYIIAFFVNIFILCEYFWFIASSGEELGKKRKKELEFLQFINSLDYTNLAIIDTIFYSNDKYYICLKNSDIQYPINKYLDLINSQENLNKLDDILYISIKKNKLKTKDNALYLKVAFDILESNLQK